MLTVDDIKKLSEVFATKEDLRNELGQALDNLEHRMNDRMDKVLKELIDIRLEQTTHRHEHDRFNDRIQRVESTPTVTHELNLKK